MEEVRAQIGRKVGQMKLQKATDDQIIDYLRSSPKAHFVDYAEQMGYTPKQIVDHFGGDYANRVVRESPASQEAFAKIAKMKAMGVKDTDIVRYMATTPLAEETLREFRGNLVEPIDPTVVVNEVGRGDVDQYTRQLPITELKKNTGQFFLVGAGKALNDAGRAIKGFVTGKNEPNPNADSDAMLMNAFGEVKNGINGNRQKHTDADVRALAAELLKTKK